jgi:hypothetical protein
MVRKENTKMSRQLEIILEYDGENPIRNTFLCEIDDFQYSILRDYRDLHDIGQKYSHKKDSKETSEIPEWCGCYTWGTKEIAEYIESIKREIELDIDLDEQGKENLREVISELQSLHDIAMEKCKENDISPENLYINWWIDY